MGGKIRVYRIAIVGLGAQTHGFDMNARHLVPSVAKVVFVK